MVRRQFTNRERLRLVALSRERQAQGESLKSICRDLGIQPKQIRDWRAREQRIAAASSKNKSISRGRPSSIAAIEEPLLQWLVDMREIGFPLSIKEMMVRAELLMPQQLAGKSELAKYQIVRRLLIANEITIRVGTHVSQEVPQNVRERSQDFLVAIRPVVAALPKRLVINMDQTPVYFSMAPNRTLELSGTRTVTILASSQHSTRATISVAVTAAGGLLTPMLTFKGKRDGRIATRELPHNPETGRLVLNCQDNAWIDEYTMLQWVNNVLRPYVHEVAPLNVHPRQAPVLLLDAFNVHSCESVLAAIRDLGVRVYRIPKGCTGLVQPVDVGIGRPLKSRIRRAWYNFMLEQGLDVDVFPSPSRDELSRWVADSLYDLDEELIKNAWKKTDASYFPDE